MTPLPKLREDSTVVDIIDTLQLLYVGGHGGSIIDVTDSVPTDILFRCTEALSTATDMDGFLKSDYPFTDFFTRVRSRAIELAGIGLEADREEGGAVE